MGMGSWFTRGSKSERAPSETFENVPCPFCGLLCDDLEVTNAGGGTLEVKKNGCGRAIAGFQRPADDPKPAIAGREVSLQEAITAAAAILRDAKLPLFGGLATDVEGVRAAIALAERASGVIDHALSEGLYRNYRVLQSSGWIMSTLTETRNRADLIVIVATDVHKVHQRFFERIIATPHSMFDETPPKRTVVFLGEGLDVSGAQGSRIGEVVTIPCPLDQVGSVIAALRASFKGLTPSSGAAGIAAAEIDALAARIRDAAYPVFAWASSSLGHANADLTIQSVSDFIKELNVTQRAAGLALGGSEGSATAGSVSAWQSGYPLRVSYASGRPDHDSYRYAIPRMLAAGEGDALVWVGSIGADISPPETGIPTIVLGAPGLKIGKQPDVYIPVGTPGLDHAGRLIRCDGVVSLHLKNLGRAPLPRVADVLSSIEKGIQ